jgi:tetratricopeptide (TPR) repeat protein
MRRLGACFLIALLPAATAIAQQVDALSSSSAGASPIGVSVPDSPGAAELLQKARDKEQQKQWKTAAEFYQSALEKYSRRVAAWQIDVEHDLFSYAGVGLVVQRRLAKWPEEGLTVYQQLYGQTAADALAAATDSAALDHVYSDYFVTDAGAAAGIRLMDLHLEAGRFWAATWVGQQLLELHPHLQADRPMVLFRTAMAWHWANDEAKAQQLLDELKQKYPAESGSIGGRDVVLADVLAAALRSAAPQPTTRPEDADVWPSFGGPGGGAQVSSSMARPGASNTKIPLVQPTLTASNPQLQEQYRTADLMDLAMGKSLGVMPAADGGSLFFQDGRHLYAVNSDTGRPLRGWTQIHGGEHPGIYSVDEPGRARGEQLTVTVTPQCVLAVMGQPDDETAIPGRPISASQSRLVCVDRANGRELWTAWPHDLPETALRDGDYNGTARVVGDSVLIVERGGQDQQFENCYVVCLKLSDGQYRWSTYVGSASRVVDAENGFNPKKTSQISVADGRLFVLSNLGTIATLDANDGRILWLSGYPRNADANQTGVQQGMAGANIAIKPWTQNPVVVAEGKVLALPADGKNLLVYDAGSGTELKRIVTADYDDANVLLGMRGNAVVLTTDKGCYCIDWTLYDHDNPDKAILWARKDVAADTIAGEENSVFGRGFLTSDSVFVPTRHRLYQLGWFKGGKVLSMYPARGAWFGGQEPGNMLVTSQQVIIAGSTRVDIYTELELVRKRYEHMMAAAPDEPGPRLEFADVLFNAGEEEAALGELDEAIRLDGGIESMRPGAGRELIFGVAMDFAKHAGEAPAETTGTTADHLFDRANAAANSPVEKASYRLARAAYDQDRKNYSGAVSLCQEILSDEQMRAANGTEAEAAIEAAKHADASCYAPVEEKATAALAAAGQGDATRLMGVAIEFPNSKAATQARVLAADRFAAEGKYDPAIEALRQIYTSATDPAAKGTALESIARSFLAMPGGVGPAIDRLTSACRLGGNRKLSQPMRLPDGSSLSGISFADAVTALRRVAAQEETAKLADFRLGPPTRKDGATAFVATEGSVISNVAALVRPMGEFAKMDQVVTWSNDGLSVFAVGQTSPTWTAASVTEQPIACAWVENQLVVWSGQRLWLLSDVGAVKWNSDLHGLAEVAVASDGNAISDAPGMVSDDQNGNIVFQQQVAQQQAIQIARQQAFIVRGGGRLIIRGGMVQLIGPGNAAPVVPVAAVGGEQIVAVRPAGKRVVVATNKGRVLGVDWADGHVAWQIRLSENAVSQLLANPHYTVVRLDDPAGSTLVVIDAPGGKVIGRRKYGPENMPTQLVNVALSEEGMMALTLTNKLFVKDLYEPWATAPVELSSKDNTEAAPFSGCGGTDQLLIHGGRILAAYDGGKFIRVSDLTEVSPGQTDEGDPLASGTDSADFAMRLVGPQLFITHSKSFARYNLLDPADHTAPDPYELDYPPRIREMFLGRDYEILLNNPIDRGAAGSPFVQLMAFRRAPYSSQSTKESGVLDYLQTITDQAGIMSWQPVNGGMYYLGGDSKLHLLQSARPKS